MVKKCYNSFVNNSKGDNMSLIRLKNMLDDLNSLDVSKSKGLLQSKI